MVAPRPRRRMSAPASPNPTIIDSQVAGSGTAPVLKLPVRAPVPFTIGAAVIENVPVYGLFADVRVTLMANPGCWTLEKLNMLLPIVAE